MAVKEYILKCANNVKFTHKGTYWETDIKPILLKAFKVWRHVKCEKQYSLLP